MTDEAADDSGGAPSARRRSVRTQRAILEATIDVLGEVGYQDLSIERVAARAGVGKATIYRWWGAKSALVVEALQSGTAVAEPVRTGSARSDLRAAIRAVGEAHAADLVGATLPALASSIAEGSPEAERLRRFLGPRRDIARQALHRAAADGLLPADIDIELIIDICVGTLFFRKLIGGHRVDGAAVERLASLIVDGCAPRISPAPHACAPAPQ